MLVFILSFIRCSSFPIFDGIRVGEYQAMSDHSTAAHVKGSADPLELFSRVGFFIPGLPKQGARKNLSSLACSSSRGLPMTQVRVRCYCSVVESFLRKSFN